MKYRLCMAAGAVLALLALGCSANSPGSAVCETSFETCRAEGSTKPGTTCVCRSQYWAHPGVVR